MKFRFRKSCVGDKPFYYVCFDCDVFSEFVYGERRIHNFARYLERGDKGTIKFVVETFVDGAWHDLGFCHSYKVGEQSLFEFVGGIAPCYFNRGFGIYAYIAIIDSLFHVYQDFTFMVGVNKENNRSLKMHLAVGFRITREREEQFSLSLIREDFYNERVKYWLQRIKVENFNAEFFLHD